MRPEIYLALAFLFFGFVELTQLFLNYYVHRGNYRHQETQIKNLEASLREASEYIQKLQKTKDMYDQAWDARISKTAFILSAKGIKMLPEDWKKRLSLKVRKQKVAGDASSNNR